MKVPLLDLKLQYAALRADIDAALARVVDSQQFILGPEVEALEQEIAAYCGAAHAIGVSSGTDALLISLMAEGIGAGSEVITTPFSFFATAGVVARLGARPVFADIDAATFNLDADVAISQVTAATRAIMPVHLFGRCADVQPLLEFADVRDIAVIEDAAQAIGATDPAGRAAGAMGTMGCFSFFPSKNLGAFGDAGMVTTNRAHLAERLRILRVHGSEPKYHHSFVGGNFRLDALQAAVLRVKLGHLAEWAQARRRNAQRYRDLCGEARLEEHVTLPLDAAGHVYNQFVIRSARRDELRAHLRRAGIGTEIYYPTPLHLQPCFRDLGYSTGAFPHSEKASREVLALPIYPELTESQIAYVVSSIARFFA